MKKVVYSTQALLKAKKLTGNQIDVADMVTYGVASLQLKILNVQVKTVSRD